MVYTISDVLDKIVAVLFLLVSIIYMIDTCKFSIKIGIKFFKYKEFDIFEKNRTDILNRFIIISAITYIILSGIPVGCILY